MPFCKSLKLNYAVQEFCLTLCGNGSGKREAARYARIGGFALFVRNQACIENSAFPLALAVFKSSERSIPCPTRGMTAFQKTRSSGQTKTMCTLLEFSI